LALVDDGGRSFVDRTRLDVDRLSPDVDVRRRGRREDGQARETDGDLYIRPGLRDRCSAEHGADQILFYASRLIRSQLQIARVLANVFGGS
jgi:hypothetical protein